MSKVTLEEGAEMLDCHSRIDIFRKPALVALVRAAQVVVNAAKHHATPMYAEDGQGCCMPDRCKICLALAAFYEKEKGE